MAQSRFEERKPIKLEENISKFSFNEQPKEPLNNDFLATKKRLWESGIHMGNDDVGRIIKNHSPNKPSPVHTPRKFNQLNAEIRKFSEDNQEDVDF